MPDLSTVDLHSDRETAPGFGQGQVVLKPRKARPFYARHPWVLASAIARVEPEVADGAVVDVFSDQGKFVARGLYNQRSRIAVRLYTWDVQESLDTPFWRRRLDEAIALRRRIGYTTGPETAERLVFGEADGLSGLIVDRYDAWLALQVNALGMAQRLDELAAALAERLAPRGILVRTEKGVAQLEGIEHREGLVWGEAPTGPVFIRENGLRFGLDLAEGQKTGFYLDQRENRRAAAAYCRDARVLDMFCYSGAFALNAALHGPAREVWAFDSSPKAIALAKANAELNKLHQARFEAADCFDALEALGRNGQRFGVVIVDPPKFARSRAAIDDALRAYHRVNRLAVEVLEPGGILITCSCSGHVSREDFRYMLSGVAQQTRRSIQILEERGASADHPVNVACLESEYLKCFVCRVT